MANGICDSYCKDCVYNRNVSSDWTTMCAYYLVTNIRRPCPAGTGCTVKKTGKTENQWSYQNNNKWEGAKRKRKNIRLEHKCKWCGKPFGSNRTDAKYCSTECRKAAALERQRIYDQYKAKLKNQQRIEIVRVCPMCGRVFHTEYNAQIYCSKQCKKDFNNRAGTERRRAARNGKQAEPNASEAGSAD